VTLVQSTAAAIPWHGRKWQRVVRVVSRLPHGDAVDRELAAVLAPGDLDALREVEEALAAEGFGPWSGLGIPALDLVTLVADEAGIAGKVGR
jgi:hypothetical protein